MFVTRMSLRGLTQINGAFSIHTALLITVLLYLPNGDYTDQQVSQGDHEMNPDDLALYRLLIATHAMLMLSTLLVSWNIFEGLI